MRRAEIQRLNRIQTNRNIEVNSFPNPTFDQTNLSFQLEEAQKVSLRIVHPATRRIIAVKLEDQYLLEGTHQYHFDLHSLPEGIYLMVLKTALQTQSIPIVKVR